MKKGKVPHLKKHILFQLVSFIPILVCFAIISNAGNSSNIEKDNLDHLKKLIDRFLTVAGEQQERLIINQIKDIGYEFDLVKSNLQSSQPVSPARTGKISFEI